MQSLLTALPSLSFLAILAPIAMCWSQVKQFLTNTVRLFLVEAQVHNSASLAVLYYLREHGKRAPTNVAKYDSIYEYIKKSGNLKMLVFEGTRDLKTQWFWFERSLITVSDKRGMDKETSVTTNLAISLRYIRGTVDIENLICCAIKWYENRDSIDETARPPRFYVQRFVGKPTDIQRGASPSYEKGNSMPASEENWKYSRLINYAIADIGYSKRDFFHVFNANATKIKDDVTRWLNAKKWYEKKGLLFRRGALLWGPPGSGKSSLIRKIGQSLDLPVISFELATMNDTQFIDFWSQARQSQPCIVVMEDIDTVFNKRAPANANVKLSFECLLNCITCVEHA